MRKILLLTVLFCCVNMTAGIVASENPANGLPPIPKGYQNEDQIKAAIFTGQVKLIDAANVPVPDSIVEELDIEYGKIGGRSLKLDLYRPKATAKPVPAIIFIHGGAWKGGDKSHMKFYAVRFAKQGYVTASIAYRFSQEAPFPAAVEDAKCAVRWLRAHAKTYNVDPDKIAVSGNSAGGHLSLMVGYSSDVEEWEGQGGNSGVSSRVQAVINFYGPVDLTTPFAQKQSVVHQFLAGKKYDEEPKLYHRASPITYLTQDDPPTLIFHGSIDSTVPIDQADMLADKLSELGIPYLYDQFEGWPHTMDLAQVVNDRCCYQMDRFLEKFLPLND